MTAEALQPVLQPVLRRSVRSVVARHSEACEALCSVAMGQQTSWTLQQWTARLAELESVNESVSDWLALND